MRSALLVIAAACLAAAGCGPAAPSKPQTIPFPHRPAVAKPRAVDGPAPDQPPLVFRPALEVKLAQGFSGTVFAKEVGAGRGIAAASNGVVFVIRFETTTLNAIPGEKTRSGPRHGILALKDDDGDAVADRREGFADFPGLGLKVRRDAEGREWLYASNETEVWRWPIVEGELAPKGAPQRIAKGFPAQREHPHKALAFDDLGGMYVVVGSPSNACQIRNRVKGSPGEWPCPVLERQAGIWRFDADAPDQDFKDAERYATGLRNATAMDWSRDAAGLYVAQHGRDVLSRFFPDMFSPEDNAELPSEELFRVERAAHLGWPYSYFDQLKGERMVMPEYGGDRTTATDAHVLPIVGFPGHWAPSALVAYDRAQSGGRAFPENWRGGLFVVFKGGWNRAPLPQGGHRVVFVPLAPDGAAAGPWRNLATEFGGPGPIATNVQAAHWPIGAAIDREGALLVTDEKAGYVWRFVWTGETAPAGPSASPPHAQTPAPDRLAALAARSGLSRTRLAEGEALYQRFCAECHQIDGSGAAGFQPPIAGSPILAGDPETLAGYVLLGAEPAPGSPWANVMPAYADEPLSDDELAALLTYSRAAFAETHEPVSAADVAVARDALAGNPP